MAAELVAAATNEKLEEIDWMKNIEICELVSRDPGQAKDVVKAIKKRMKSRHPSAQLWAINSAGVKFSQAPRVCPVKNNVSKEPKDTKSEGKPVSRESVETAKKPSSQIVSESSIMEKAGAALEVLRDVLDAIDSQNPEGAKDEFTLDLVEQCSFQKQRVMHLVLTSRDERVVSQAIKLNEQLQNALARHDALLSFRATSTATNFTYDDGQVEEEEDEMLFRRIRKGKACMRPEDEDHVQRPVTLVGLSHEERLHRPLIRPLSSEPKESSTPLPPIIPPPPAKHIERENYFKKRVDGSLGSDMSGLTLHSRNTSSSRSGSIDSSD